MAKASQFVAKPAADQGHDPRVDAIIVDAPAFAQPILRHLRDVVHDSCPDATETIKWGRPFFELHGQIVCMMSAFTRHVSFGFWSKKMTARLAADGIDGTEGSGSLGKIRRLEDLPPRQKLMGYIREAADDIRRDDVGETIASGSRRRESAKAPLPMPPEFAAALAKSQAAAANFEAFSPSCRREYLEWIGGAKQQGTRDRRVEQAVSQITEGKRHNWQYAKK